MGTFANQQIATYSNTLLIDSMKQLFSTYEQEKALPYHVKFLPYKPIASLSLMSDDVITTYRLYSAKPGSLDGRPFSNSVRDVTPKDFKEAEEGGIKYEVGSQYMDMLVEFCVSAASTQYADEVANIFMNFMMLARKPLRQYGVSDLYFWERMPDDAVQVKNDLYYTRTLRYFVRALYAMATPQDTVRQITYVVKQTNDNY